MTACLFCKIVNQELPAQIIFQDEQVIAFRDIDPKAPTHVLVIPRRHIATLNEATEAEQNLLGHLFLTGKKVAQQEGLHLRDADDACGRGYRLVLNCDEAAGQTVFHLHLHVLGGRVMNWPPG